MIYYLRSNRNNNNNKTSADGNGNNITHETRSASTSINPDESEVLLLSPRHCNNNNENNNVIVKDNNSEVVIIDNSENMKKDLANSPESIILTNSISNINTNCCNEIVSVNGCSNNNSNNNNGNNNIRIPSPESLESSPPLFPSSSPMSISVGGETIPLSFNQYSSNFTELQCIGSGGFSKVFLTKRIIDESMYAVKKIPITLKINTATTISEVRLMAKLHHQNIVRYYQAWYEAVEKGTFTLDNGEEESEEEEEESEEEEEKCCCMKNNYKRKNSCETHSNKSNNNEDDEDDDDFYLFKGYNNNESSEEEDDDDEDNDSDENDNLNNTKDSLFQRDTTDSLFRSESSNTRDSLFRTKSSINSNNTKDSLFQRESSYSECSSYADNELGGNNEDEDDDEQKMLNDIKNKIQSINKEKEKKNKKNKKTSATSPLSLSSKLLTSTKSSTSSNSLKFQEFTPHTIYDEMVYSSSTPSTTNTENTNNTITPITPTPLLSSPSKTNNKQPQQSSSSSLIEQSPSKQRNNINNKKILKISPQLRKNSKDYDNNNNNDIIEDSDTVPATTSIAEIPYSQDWEYILYIQMEYCGQGTLKDKLLNPPPDVLEKEKVEIIIQISKALKYIHKSGMIHRDVKPENIFFHNDDNVRLGDFGISRTNEKKIINHNKRNNNDKEIGEGYTAGLGSILYVSPEQLSSSRYDQRTDIFSLGMVFFEMFLPSFSTTMEKYLVFKQAKNGVFPKYYEKRMSESTFELIQSMIKHNPDERPSLDEIITKCEEIKEPNKSYVIIIQSNGSDNQLSSISNEITKCGGIMEYFCPLPSINSSNRVSLSVRLENTSIDLIIKSLSKLDITIESCQKNKHQIV